MNGHPTSWSGSLSPRGFSVRWLCALLLGAGLGGLVPVVRGADAPMPQLLAAASVTGEGIFLAQIFSSAEPLPVIRLGDAPAFGRNLTFTRAQVRGLLVANAPGVGTNFSGPDAILISRRSRALGETGLLSLLTASLQQEYVQDKGRLELRLIQPWPPIVVPDEPLALEVTELPSAGVTPGFIVRFTLRAGNETHGNSSANVKASVWHEVWVAAVQLKLGDPLAAASLLRERRDVLTLREPLAAFAADDDSLELAEAVPPGQPLLARMVKARSVVHRGQHADALVQDGALSVRTRVEILEDGAPGQLVHAVNSLTHRSLVGTVLNDRTILISL